MVAECHCAKLVCSTSNTCKLYGLPHRHSSKRSPYGERVVVPTGGNMIHIYSWGKAVLCQHELHISEMAELGVDDLCSNKHLPYPDERKPYCCALAIAGTECTNGFLCHLHIKLMTNCKHLVVVFAGNNANTKCNVYIRTCGPYAFMHALT